MSRPQHIEEKLNPTVTEPQPSVVSWHYVTYVSEDTNTVTWDEGGTPLVIPKAQFKSPVVTTASKTELLLLSDSTYHAVYYD